jgi:hypothetical protein
MVKHGFRAFYATKHNSILMKFSTNKLNSANNFFTKLGSLLYNRLLAE